MSISKFREFVEKSGCGWVVAIVTSLIMLFGLITVFGRNNQNGANGAEPGAGDIAVVGDTGLSLNYVNNFADRTRQQMQQQSQGRPLTLEDEASIEGHALEQSVIAGMLLVLAKQEGVQLTEESIGAAMDKQAQESWAAQRAAWIKDKKLQPNATQADFDALYKKEYNVTPQQTLEANHKMLAERLNGPDAFEIKISYANILLIDHYGKTLPSSEADVLKSYDQYNCKRIVLEKAKHPGEDLVAKLNKVKAEIKAGLSFEAAMDKYSDEAEPQDPKDAKKKRPKHENVFQLDGTTAQINESYAPIAMLKQGEISEPLSFANSIELYRLDSVVSTAPADFKTNFEQYRKTFIEPRAVTKMQEGITKLKTDPSKIQWTSEGYHVLYDKQIFSTDSKNFSLDPTERKKRLNAILERAKKAMDEDQVGGRVASLVTYVTMEEIYNSTEPKDRAPLEASRDQILEKMADTLADPDISLKLVATFAQRKDKDKLATALDKTISNLMSSLDAKGQTQFAQVNAEIDRFQKDGLLTADQVTGYKQRLEEWKKAKIDHDKYEAQAKKEAEEQRKADEAAAKKAEEELKKEEEAAKAKAKNDVGDVGKQGEKPPIKKPGS